MPKFLQSRGLLKFWNEGDESGIEARPHLTKLPQLLPQLPYVLTEEWPTCLEAI